MTQRLRTIGRLGYFVVMAGVSWFVEACSRASDGAKEPNELAGSNGGSNGGSSGGSAATGGSTALGGADGGTTSKGGALGGSSATRSGGQGGLHDIPCE